MNHIEDLMSRVFKWPVTIRDKLFSRSSGLPKIEETISVSVDAVDLVKGQKISLRFVLFDYSKAEYKHGLPVKNVVFDRCLFVRGVIEGCNFHHCIFHDCIFNGAVIKGCSFHDCEIVNSSFYKVSISDTYIDPRSFKFSFKWYRYWSNVNVDLFQGLYRNSKNMHQELFAMHADKSFIFYKRYVDFFGVRFKPFSYIRSVFYDVFLGSGYGILNAMFSTVLLISCFSFIIDGAIKPVGDFGFLSSLYFAVVSFTTVGYGDSSPNPEALAMGVTMLFLLLSVVWGAIFSAIVVKRIVK